MYFVPFFDYIVPLISRPSGRGINNEGGDKGGDEMDEPLRI